jgi:hypothetical protein
VGAEQGRETQVLSDSASITHFAVVHAPLCFAQERGADEGVRPYIWDSASGGEILADSLDGVALILVQRQEFETIAEALAVTNDCAHFDGIRR